VQISVLLLDLNLPGIFGLELLGLLRQDAAWTEPPVIIVSAVADQPEIQTELRQTGITTIVSKPFDVDQVIALIQQALAELCSANSPA
jgi:CheY-like chemotaxis protein